MLLLINAENLDLNDRVKARLQDILEKLQDALPGDPQVRLFLKRIGKNEIRSTLIVRALNHDVAYTSRGEKLIPLVRAAEAHLVRRLRNHKEKIVHARKRRHHHQHTHTAA